MEGGCSVGDGDGGVGGEGGEGIGLVVVGGSRRGGESGGGGCGCREREGRRVRMREVGGGEGGHCWRSGVGAEVGVGGEVDVGAEGGEEGWWERVVSEI